MSACCMNFPKCECDGISNQRNITLDDIDESLFNPEIHLESKSIREPFDVEEHKRQIARELNRKERGGSSINPRRKHATNYTPPKKKRRRK